MSQASFSFWISKFHTCTSFFFSSPKLKVKVSKESFSYHLSSDISRSLTYHIFILGQIGPSLLWHFLDSLLLKCYLVTLLRKKRKSLSLREKNLRNYLMQWNQVGLGNHGKKIFFSTTWCNEIKFGLGNLGGKISLVPLDAMKSSLV